ncbi:MAG: sensor histidine kinase [Leptolyngbyaceae cyanobacterium SM1_4_3]|nr:sensor histidine kinase [Leptolyngbyaceae cyanobacterium SM1_4_3]NJN90994.1 sensor histidine kinase [Leptolyngbyaceae cyanobacterium SL_5_14]
MDLSSRSRLWTLRCAEWLLLLAMMLLFVFSQTTSLELILKCTGFSVLFFLLSFILPIERPLWQRRTYVALEVALIGIATALGVEFSGILFFLLLKSCFLLSRQDVIITAIAGGIVYLIGFSWLYPSFMQRTIPGFDCITIQSDFHISLLYVLFYYVNISIFMILLGSVIIAERNSRQRAEMLSQEVETLAAHVERLRIARELHDSLGHTLTSLSIQLEVAQKLRERNPEKSFLSVDNAALLTSQCLQDVRQLVQTMRQSRLNLNEALHELIEQMRQQTIAVQVDLRLPTLSLQISHQLYCILKEGLINIQKHAQASNVVLRGYTTSEALLVTLQDDGQGFDPEHPTVGYGLRGMQERSELAGGTLHIMTAPGQGTQIQVMISHDSSSRRG